MYHLILCLFVLGVDAIVPHTHNTQLSRRLHRHPQTLDIFPRSSHAMNPVDQLVYANSGSSGQARQLKREVTDGDWAHAASVETSPNKPEHGVNYLSETGPGPAAHLARPIPATKSSVGAAPASTSHPAEPPPATASSHQATRKSTCG